MAIDPTMASARLERDKYLRAKISELEAHNRILVEALRAAGEALRHARDGLDFGLGQARTNEGDESPIPEKPMSRMLDNYLKYARWDHAAVLVALSAVSEEKK